MQPKNLPATTTPAEAIAISPEALEIANSYLEFQNIDKVAEILDLPKDMVVSYLDKREVKAYIDSVFLNLGFNNRFKLRRAMDSIIAMKFKELDEAGIGSSKDIADLLILSHKMTMDEYAKQIELAKIHQKEKITTQTNIQINDQGGSNYSKLLHTIINNVQSSD